MNLNELTSLQFEERLKASLNLDILYDESWHRTLSKTQLDTAKSAAVLALFGYSGTSPSILYIRRTDTVETHKGQMAFPGGRCESEDLCVPEVTALRETEEEVGISRNFVRVLGKIPSLLTVTGYHIEPIVGILKCPIEEISLVLDPAETAEAMWISVNQLMHPSTYQKEILDAGSVRYAIDVYQVESYRIWGATGSMTKNILDRLNSVL